jgi:hypothetical protein
MKDRNIAASPQRDQESDAGKRYECTRVNIINETIQTGRQKITSANEIKKQ